MKYLFFLIFMLGAVFAGLGAVLMLVAQQTLPFLLYGFAWAGCSLAAVHFMLKK